ncbi:MAG: hypothetical protein HFJ84_08045 [Clostridiales bacterium]|nr:hypothetical protein [Clostridiales bacterium]
MIQAAIEKILTLNENKIHEINGQYYSEKDLIRIAPHIDRPEKLKVSSLDSLVKLIHSELDKVKMPVFVQIEDYDAVNVFTSYREDYSRDFLYRAVCDVPEFRFGWKDYESAMIAFRSQFQQTEGVEYLLGLLSRIADENSVSSEDNGVTQTVEARKGIALKSKEKIKPRVSLCPYRTFLEVEQPESEFLIRMREGGEIGLFEADGGMWKLEAKKTIRSYFEKELLPFMKNGSVIVMV